MLQLIHFPVVSRVKAILASVVFLLYTTVVFEWRCRQRWSFNGSGVATEQSHEVASGAEHEKAEKKFDAGAMILEHIGDSHDWHIMEQRS